LDALPLPQRMPSERIVSFLQTMAHGSQAEILEARVARRAEAGLHLSDVQAEMNLSLPEGIKLAVQVANQEKLVTGDHQIFISTAAFDQILQNTLAALSKFHDANPLAMGIGKEELRDRVNLDPDVFYAALKELYEKKKMEGHGELVRLPGRGVVMKDDEAESKQMIEKTFASAGLQAPALKDVLAGLKVDKVRAQKIITLLLRDKVLVKVSDDLVFHQSALQGLRQRMAAEKAKSAKIDVGRFKDLAGVSRKYAIPLLEYLDRERVTRRVGNDRIIN
ncbi:MAG TPA: SelB C-terminal domain-containing protein, partial [Terriglobales bacterium]